MKTIWRVATKTKLGIDELEIETAVAQNAKAVELFADLDSGSNHLQTWLLDDNGRSKAGYH